MYFTYILFSLSMGKFYCGSTEDIIRRLSDHNAGKSKYTSKGRPWDLIWHQEFQDRGEAMKLENKIKKRGMERFLEQQKITNF